MSSYPSALLRLDAVAATVQRARAVAAPVVRDRCRNAEAVLQGRDCLVRSSPRVRLGPKAWAALRERGHPIAQGPRAAGCRPRDLFALELVETTDRDDRAHGVVDPSCGRLYPARDVPNATPRRYPRTAMVEVRFGRERVGLVGIDSAADAAHEARRRLYHDVGAVDGVTASHDHGVGEAERMKLEAIARIGVDAVRGQLHRQAAENAAAMRC